MKSLELHRNVMFAKLLSHGVGLKLKHFLVGIAGMFRYKLNTE